MTKSIEDIEGIGPRTGRALRGVGICTVEELLEKGADRSARRCLAASTGISEAKLLKFVNMADLFRINGVASQYAELLECAGVDTVKELSGRSAENLAESMAKANEARCLVRRAPSAVVVNGWVSQAKKLPVKVTY